MKNLILPLVNWGMGAIIIGIFAVVCIVMVAVVYHLANSDKKGDKSQS
ncbi:hypothetical protein [uncultured Dokdonia sp.]|nr:hypothetical protein [uncultured Dokdonia sp.]